MKPFDRVGGYTVFDNAILDKILPMASPSAWKVLCVVIRQTRGWNKEYDFISYSQFKEKSNILSRTTLSKALKECESAGWIIRSTSQAEGILYTLNRNYELPDLDGKMAEITEKKMKVAEERKAKRLANRDPLLDHPAVVEYRKICQLTPRGDLRKKIADTVFDVDRWSVIISEWLRRGYSPTNLYGMLAVYTKGWSQSAQPYAKNWTDVTEERLASQ